MAENNDFSLLNFPDKLWYMINEPTCEQIEWHSDGTSIIIPNNQEFVTKVLNNPSRILFKTKNFSSFVRQLNLYGFRKVSEQRKLGQSQPVATNRSEFKHPCFKKDRKDLLEDVKRQPNANKKEESPSEEKTRSSNDALLMQHYGPAVHSNPPTVGGFWTNWDPYMCPFSWIPYGGAAGGYTMSNPPQYQAQTYYGKDGLPYYLPQYSPMTSCAPHSYNEIYAAMNGNHASGLTNEHAVPHSGPATLSLQTTPSAVVISKSLSRDTITGSSCYSISDVGKNLANENIGGHRLQVEAKKPIPAQTAEVSTTSNGRKVTGQSTAGVHTDKLTKDKKLRGFDHDQCSVIQDYKKLKFIENEG